METNGHDPERVHDVDHLFEERHQGVCRTAARRRKRQDLGGHRILHLAERLDERTKRLGYACGPVRAPRFEQAVSGVRKLAMPASDGTLRRLAAGPYRCRPHDPTVPSPTPVP